MAFDADLIRKPLKLLKLGIHDPAPTHKWFLIEGPDSEDAPTKYRLSTLPAETPMAEFCIAVYWFLVSERGRFPPSAPEITERKALALPAGYRPRGAPNPARATRA